MSADETYSYFRQSMDDTVYRQRHSGPWELFNGSEWVPVALSEQDYNHLHEIPPEQAGLPAAAGV